MKRKTLIGTALLVILTDQVSKTFVVNNSYPYIINNAGVFGWFNNIGTTAELSLYLLVAIITYLSFRKTKNTSLEATALGLLLGGGLGNLIDRLAHNGVVDFLNIPTPFGGNLKFNIADIALTSTVAIMAIDYATQKYIKS